MGTSELLDMRTMCLLYYQCCEMLTDRFLISRHIFFAVVSSIFDKYIVLF